MKSEFFLRAVGDIDDALITEADAPRQRRIHLRPIGTIAACLVCAVGIFATWHFLAPAMDEVENDCAVSTSPEREEMVDDASPPEAAAGQWLFWFYEDGTWRSDTRAYPNGLPVMETILNDYLTASLSTTRCILAQSETISDVTTIQITLSEDVDENLLKGLANTALQSGTEAAADQVQITTPGESYGPIGAFDTDLQ